ncbi:hypothetical protein RI129_003887 [Pyrocoelia pectoralis]|uniref:Uncharacterized protein n=1 Tax=Pyrocoelia pectoralis TaxID=417401 RepID=A0AAN7ZIZ9_9COLE
MKIYLLLFEFDNDYAASESHDYHSLPLEDNVGNTLYNIASLPHDAHVPFNSYSAPILPVEPAHVAVPAPVGLSVDTHVLVPHVEVFRFIETFIQFKNELLARLQILINENWDLVRAIINLVIGKIQKLGGFTLVGISILRKVCEFALGLFGSWSINLPSISVGASTVVEPHATYGVPDVFTAATNFFNGFH